MRKLTAYLLMALVFALIACGGQPKLYSVGGSVTGLNGTLTLQNNGADDLVITVDGSFTFATKVADGNAYDVTVKQGPTTQNCAVTNGSGTISGAGVTNVLVGCTDKTWHRPANLTDHLSVAGTGAYNPQVALNDVGDAVVVWYQSDGNNLQVYKAELHGGNWNMPANLDEHLSSAGTDAYGPLVALNATGDALVVWQQKDGNGDYQVYRAERHDGGWNLPANLNDHLSVAGTGTGNPQVALNAAGDAVVVWYQDDDSGNSQIYKAELRGGSWNLPADLDDHLSVAGTDATYPQVALNAAGDAVVVWYQSNGNNLQVYKAELRGGSWSLPADLDDHLSVAGTDAYYPQIALNATDDAVAVWMQYNVNNLQIYKAERQGGNWSKPADLDDHLSVEGTHANYPKVALNAACDVVVVWKQHDGNNLQIYKAERQGGIWSKPADLDDHLSVEGTDASATQVTLNVADDALVVWHQYDVSTIRHVYKAERRGGSWNAPADLGDNLSPGGTDAYSPQLALNAVGNAIVVWQQRDGSDDSQIYKAEYR